MKTLLLTENVLSDINKYTNDNTDIILYNIGDTYDSILNKINSDTSYNTIGIFSHGNHHSFDFVEKININENNNFINFINSLKTKTNFNTLDIFACYFGINSQFIKTLEEKTDINVRASKNITGSTVFGDWIMETDQIDIKTIYFNENISDFKVSLVLPLFSNDIKACLKKNSICNLINPRNKYLLKNQIYSNTINAFTITLDGKVADMRILDSARLQIPKIRNTSDMEDVKNVESIYIGYDMFVALNDNGNVITWDPTTIEATYIFIPNTLNYVDKVKKIYTEDNLSWFTALTDEGKIFRFNKDTRDSEILLVLNIDINMVNSPIENINDIISNTYVSNKLGISCVKYAATTTEGYIATWHAGDPYCRYLRDVQDNKLTGFTKIYPSTQGFIALNEDGNAYTWILGNYWESFIEATYIKDNTGEKVSNIKKIFCGTNTFVGLTEDNYVYMCKQEPATSQSAFYLRDVDGERVSNFKDIFATKNSYAALDILGNVIVWKDNNTNNVVARYLSDDQGNKISYIRNIYYDDNYDLFVAVNKRGEMYVWEGAYVGVTNIPGFLISGNYIKDDKQQVVSGITRIYMGQWSLIALNTSNEVFTWAFPHNNVVIGTNSEGSYKIMSDNRIRVKKIFSYANEYAAVTVDGNVVTWQLDDPVFMTYSFNGNNVNYENIKFAYYDSHLKSWSLVDNNGTVVKDHTQGEGSTYKLLNIQSNNNFDLNRINIYENPYFTYESMVYLNSIYQDEYVVSLIDFNIDINANKCILRYDEVKFIIDNFDVNILDIINYYLYSADISGNPNILFPSIMSIVSDIPTTKQNLLCINHKNVFNVNNLAQNECLFTSYIDNTNISDNYNITDGNELSLNITKSDIYYVFNNISTPSNYVPIDCSFNYKY